MFLCSPQITFWLHYTDENISMFKNLTYIRVKDWWSGNGYRFGIVNIPTLFKMAINNYTELSCENQEKICNYDAMKSN